MNVTKGQMIKFLTFLDENKQYVGLSDYRIIIKMDVLKNIEAEVLPDIFEKELEVTLSEGFLKNTEEKQLNILFHELIHARVEIFNKMIEKNRELQEELLVNDLTRGFEEMANWKFKK